MTKLSEIIASIVKKSSQSKKSTKNEIDTSHSSEVDLKQEARCVDTTDSTNKDEQSIKESLEKDEVIITEEFEKAFSLIKNKAPFLFITGRAGSGKSTFINLLKERLKSYAVVAPTGVAALNVGGQTIHSFFRLKPGPIELDQIRQTRNRVAYQALDALIIDEISMVRADLLDGIDRMLRLNGRDRNKPFGGVPIIAVGDLFQLPPIVTRDEEQAFLSRNYQSPFFFSANCMANVEIEKVEFNRVFRQKEEQFIDLLNCVREGRKLESTLLALNKNVSPRDQSENSGVILTATNKVASHINTAKLQLLQTQPKSYIGEIRDDFRIDKEKLPAPMTLILKLGAKVMFTKNDIKRRWVNGTVGEVVKLDDDRIKVEIEDNWGRRVVSVEMEIWKNFKFQYDADKNSVVATEVGSYRQFPLTLAWALTVHKSQGKTFDKVHLDLGGSAFAEGQVYVALSRCRTLSGLSLELSLIHI